MSKKHRKMLNAAINTDALMFDDEPRNDSMKKPSRLKERNVKHIKIGDSSELHEVYNFGELIGQGTFGTVISVVDKFTEKDWAMKIVNKTAVGEKLIAIQREILILKMVDHPHIIYLDRVYETTKTIYLILERCYGALSNVYKEKKPFSETDTRKIIRDLASAVAYLHKNDIVHRDLKLDNILIAQNPRDVEDSLYIKVTDFGLSIVKSGSGHEDMLHDCCGTIIYMAPEVITSHSYSQQCDIWAVGVIMYTLLSGRYPFYSANEQELMSMIRKNEPSYHDFSVSTEATHLITKMLTKNPALRITAAEIILHPWIAGKTMTHELDSPENVLDMMRLWRSEMMLPVGAECDWVTSAKAAGSSSSLMDNGKSPKFVQTPATVEKTSEKSKYQRARDSDISAETPTRRQSMRLPVKNIRFERTPNETAHTARAGRRTTIPVGIDDLPVSRRITLTPPPASNRSSSHAESRLTMGPSISNKSQLSKAADKGAKKSTK